MKFVCLGYFNESQWEKLPEDRQQQMFNECMEYDDQLRRGGHFLGGEALGTARHAVTLRPRDGRVDVTDGPFAETKEVLGGILLLEARDLNHAISLMSKHPGMQMGPFEIRASDEEVNRAVAARDAEVAKVRHSRPSAREDEAEIRRLIAAWSQALEAKDVVGLTADYVEDAVMYDAIPPYKTVGVAAIRQVWESCLPFFPEQFKSEHRDLVVHVDGDVALVHGLHHFVPTPADHPSGQTWMRITVGYRRIDGRWKVVHEHISIPFNPLDNQAWYIKDPDVADMPDYGAPPTCAAPQETQS